MKYKWIILLIVIAFSKYSNAQMFEYLDYLDKEKISQSAIGVQVNFLYDDAEKKIKELVLWELRQVKRMQKEIEFESKDLPESKILDLKFKKFAELELLVTTKEIDLDFWYLEQLDQLNEHAEENNLECTFLPETQIQGRIIKMVINHLMVDEDEYNNSKQKMEYPLIAAGFVGKSNLMIMTMVEVSALAIIEVTEKVNENVIINYSEYFSMGMMTHAREVQLEKIQNAKL